jgi:hypothetical protein
MVSLQMSFDALMGQESEQLDVLSGSSELRGVTHSAALTLALLSPSGLAACPDIGGAIATSLPQLPIIVL